MQKSLNKPVVAVMETTLSETTDEATKVENTSPSDAKDNINDYGCGYNQREVTHKNMTTVLPYHFNMRNIPHFNRGLSKFQNRDR